MSRFFVGLALWALLLALAACGGDSKGTDPARDTELAEMVDTVVSTFEDLNVCTNKREGATAYVEDEDSAYVCKKGLWAVDDSLTKAIQPDSEKKSSSSAKAKSSSNKASDSGSTKSQSSSSAVKASSSSKEGKSSSSDEKNSSSSFDFSAVPLASPCKTATEDNCEYGTLTDDRDGQTYKTVKIGEQWWMAENLNYRYIQQTYNGGEGDSSSYCYDDDPANCAKYGRLYLWSAAMVVCPEGWHLPDTTEWNALFNAVGGGETAGIMLKSMEGWYGTSGNGSDAYSFSALPAGNRFSNGNYSYEGNDARFWSSTEVNSNDACSMYLYYILDNALLNYYDKGYGFSVRCLKDYGPGSEKMSSNGKSSSSEKNSSSSSAVPLGCKTETEDNCEYGTLTDDRDGQTYKTVKIGEQWWMAENLNYRYIQQTYNGGEKDSSSYCYDNDPANCAKYGRLYLWSAAMDSAGIIPGNTANGCGYGEYCNLGNLKVRGLCPEGWHLPDTTEWSALFNAVGRKATAGKMLKSTEGWNDYDGTSGNGSDAYFFSALPAGDRNNYGDFGDEGLNAIFWSSTEYNGDYAYNVDLYSNDDSANLSGSSKYYGFSVRCLRD